MNRRVIDVLFAFILLTPPFKFANRIFALPGFISGPFTNELVVWPLLIGFIYTLYSQYKYGNVLVGWKRFKRYILIYLAVLLVSLIWGLLSYPYFDMLFNGPVSETGKFTKVMGLLSHVGIHLSTEFSMSAWILMRSVKTILLNLLYTFGGAYMIYCWYHDRVERAVQLLKNVTVGFLVVLAAYGLIEVCYQNGQMWAQNFLLFMWPILHSNPNPGHPFYPVLLGARVRSLFLEASYYGIYLAFALPVLWWKIAEESGVRRIGLGFLYLILSFELYLMQSRTATAIFIGELLLLVLGTLYLRKRKLLLEVAGVLVVALISFGSAMYFLSNYQVPVPVGSDIPVATARMNMEEQGIWPKNKINKNNQNTEGEKGDQAARYIDDSLLSLSDKDKTSPREGSNHVRYGITFANVKIAIQHSPLLGVGVGLDTRYLYEMFKSDTNPEIQLFIKSVNSEGLLNSGSPFMCEYTAQFMMSGALGLILFIIPDLLSVILLLSLLLKSTLEYKKIRTILFLIVSNIGIATTGFGNTLNITYCFWMILGLSYAVYYKYKPMIKR